MRRLPHVSLILGITFFMAADGVKDAENSSRRTDNSIGAVLDAAPWVTVSDGFILHVYSRESAVAFNKREADYKKRRQEFVTKRDSLDEKRNAINGRVPARSAWRFAKDRLRIDDTNKDGVLDGEEQKRMRRTPSDVNKDGKISVSEMFRSLLADGKPKDVPENVEELYRQLDSLDTQRDALREQYKNIRRLKRRDTLYKIIEVANDFVLIRYGKLERIIPFASIREIRRTMDD